LSYGSPATTVQNLEDGTTVADPPLEKLSVRETAEIAAWWSAVWFLANWSLNAALAMASVASVTILSSTTSESSYGVQGGG
jgi:solute carrier family 35 protein F5